MIEFTVSITLKPEINDAAGVALEKSVVALGYDDFKNFRIGKTITFNTMVTPNNTPEMLERVRDLCEEMFVNEVIEDYKISF